MNPSQIKRGLGLVTVGVVAGVIIGAVTTAEATPNAVALNAGDGVTCSGAMISDTRMNLQCDIQASPQPTASSSPSSQPTSTSPSSSPTSTSVPSPSPTTTTLTPSSTSTSTPTATSSPTTSPSSSPPPTDSWPNVGNTGTPPFANLTAYTGPCVITQNGTVIDLKLITCPLSVRATNVVITRSRIVADGDPVVSVERGDATHLGLTISDTTIVAQPAQTGIMGAWFVASRLNISGGNRGGTCNHCTIQDSWIHGQRVANGAHASGLRADQYSSFVHNRIGCDGPGQLCSGDITGYPDFETTHDWNISNNWFDPAPGTTYCVYGGSTPGKPYSNAPGNGTNIVFRNNVFTHGCMENDNLAQSGFDKTKTGNVWTGNKFDDGKPINV